MTMLRLFFAIEVGAAAQAQIEERVQAIRSHLPDLRDVRWTADCNLHITLKFLGETPAEQVPVILNVAAPIFRNYSPVHCCITQCSIFERPKGRRRQAGPPTIVRLDVEDGENLSILAGELDSALEHLGYKRERRAYVPHVTLARVRSPEAVNLILKRFADQPLDVAFTARTVNLLASDLRRDGPIYTTISCSGLGCGVEGSAETSTDSN